MTEYDAARLMEQYERDLPPLWKRVGCPRCGAEPGFRCVRQEPTIARAVGPHAARKREADLHFRRFTR